MKKILSLFLSFILIFSFSLPLLASESPSQGLTETQAAALWDYLDLSRFGEEATLSEVVAPEFDFDIKSACIIEEKSGTVLYEKNKDERYLPASVTKVMTLLLIFEALENKKIAYTDNVTASEYAASMGGTQIYLKAGEEMTVEELIKAVAVPSANDAAVALAEHIAGSETEFVRQMNERAKELGMQNTNFTNCTGLFDDENHYTSAQDIAIVSRELISHQDIYNFSTIWMDTLRDGNFTLANTNKMLKTYNGMKGLKTGYTKQSLYCFSGVAERGGMTLIVSIMGAKTSDERFSATASLLNFGFSNFAVASPEKITLPKITVEKGSLSEAPLSCQSDFSIVVPKGWESELTHEITLTEKITAPQKKGEQVGVLTYKLKDKTVKTCPITLAEDIEKASVWHYFAQMLKTLFP